MERAESCRVVGFFKKNNDGNMANSKGAHHARNE